MEALHEKNKIKSLSASMMSMANYYPSTITMQNITASGEFDLIKDAELRENLISTYNTYKITTKLESLLSDYVNQYVTPFFFENVRFSDFSSVNADFVRNPLFENMVFGYDVLLNQLIRGYEQNMEKLNQLNKKLAAANKTGG